MLKKINLPKIGWYHCGFLPYSKHFKCKNKKYAKVYDKFVVITQSFKEKLIKDKYIGDKVVQMYNPFDFEQIKQQALSCKKLPTSERYFTFVGRFHKDKDHQTTIDAFEKISDRYSDVKIYFIGDGNTRAHFEKVVKDKNLENNIIFLGVLNNPFGYMKYALANLLSSPSEGLSNVLVEGAILNTLNIASNCPSGPAEVLLEGKAGILYSIRDSNKLAQIMEDVLENRIDKNALINNANQAINRFEINNIVKQFIDLCNQVAGQV